MTNTRPDFDAFEARVERCKSWSGILSLIVMALVAMGIGNLLERKPMGKYSSAEQDNSEQTEQLSFVETFGRTVRLWLELPFFWLAVLAFLAWIFI